MLTPRLHPSSLLPDPLALSSCQVPCHPQQLISVQLISKGISHVKLNSVAFLAQGLRQSSTRLTLAGGGWVITNPSPKTSSHTGEAAPCLTSTKVNILKCFKREMLQIFTSDLKSPFVSE